MISPVALDVRRPGLHPDHVRLLEPQLGGVLDRGHPLVVGDERRQGVQERRLARARPARDDHVDPRPGCRPRGTSTISWVIAFFSTRSLNSSGVWLDRRIDSSVPSRASGRDDRVDAAAVGQAGVAHRARSRRSAGRPGSTIRWTISIRCCSSLKTTSTAPAGPCARRRRTSGPLTRMSVMVGSRIRGSSGPEAERLVEHLVDQPLALGEAQQVAALAAELLGPAADLLPQLLLAHRADRREVHLRDELLVQLLLDPKHPVLGRRRTATPCGPVGSEARRLMAGLSRCGAVRRLRLSGPEVGEARVVEERERPTPGRRSARPAGGCAARRSAPGGPRRRPGRRPRPGSIPISRAAVASTAGRFVPMHQHARRLRGAHDRPVALHPHDPVDDRQVGPHGGVDVEDRAGDPRVVQDVLRPPVGQRPASRRRGSSWPA